MRLFFNSIHNDGQRAPREGWGGEVYNLGRGCEGYYFFIKKKKKRKEKRKEKSREKERKKEKRNVLILGQITTSM